MKITTIKQPEYLQPEYFSAYCPACKEQKLVANKNFCLPYPDDDRKTIKARGKCPACHKFNRRTSLELTLRPGRAGGQKINKTPRSIMFPTSTLPTRSSMGYARKGVRAFLRDKGNDL